MITWKEYVIMQFLNTITFLIIQEFFWLKMKKKFDTVVERGKNTAPTTHLKKIKQRIENFEKITF